MELAWARTKTFVCWRNVAFYGQLTDFPSRNAFQILSAKRAAFIAPESMQCTTIASGLRAVAYLYVVYKFLLRTMEIDVVLQKSDQQWRFRWEFIIALTLFCSRFVTLWDTMYFSNMRRSFQITYKFYTCSWYLINRKSAFIKTRDAIKFSVPHLAAFFVVLLDPKHLLE